MTIDDIKDNLAMYVYAFKWVIIGFCLIILIYASVRVGAMATCKSSGELTTLSGFKCSNINVIDVCQNPEDLKYYKVVNNTLVYTGSDYKLTG